MEGESEIAFRAFNVYLNQPLPRTMAYMGKTTTHSQSSLFKWRSVFKWSERATDYDNARADQIMSKDVDIITQYQVQVTESGSADMQMLREAWLRIFQRVMGAEGVTNEAQLNYLNSLISTRMKIEDLARKTARMPEKYKDIALPDDAVALPQNFIQLTLAGPQSEELTDGEYSQSEEETSTKQSSSEIISLTSETGGDQDSPAEV